MRFGSAEIYDVVERCFAPGAGAEDVVADSLAVGLRDASGADERVVLFVRLPDGAALTPALVKKIKDAIRARRSARHVPAEVSGAPERGRAG